MVVTNEGDKASCAHFSAAIFMQITKITLIYFLDNSYANIFQKHLGAVKIKVNIFIDIFEVKDHPLFMCFVVNWW